MYSTLKREILEETESYITIILMTKRWILSSNIAIDRNACKSHTVFLQKQLTKFRNLSLPRVNLKFEGNTIGETTGYFITMYSNSFLFIKKIIIIFIRIRNLSIFEILISTKMTNFHAALTLFIRIFKFRRRYR